MTRVAYLIKSHRNTDQVERLARTLVEESPSAQVAIHHNPEGSRLPDVSTWGDDRVHLLSKRVTVRQLSWSMAEASLLLMAWALERTEVDWVVLLSGQDYPLVRVLDIERSLSESDVDGYIDGEPIDGNSSWNRECFLRYHFHHRRLFKLARIPDRAIPQLRRASNKLNATQSLVNVHVGAGSENIWVGYRRHRTPYGRRPGWVGSEWAALSRTALQALLRVVRDEPELVCHYRRTLFACESFFHTILFNEPGLRLRRDNLHYIAWSDLNTPHPRVLGIDDLPAARASGKYLARKFDESMHPGVLDALDLLRRQDQ